LSKSHSNTIKNPAGFPGGKHSGQAFSRLFGRQFKTGGFTVLFLLEMIKLQHVNWVAALPSQKLKIKNHNILFGLQLPILFAIGKF
jgi:hypothetical protein